MLGAAGAAHGGESSSGLASDVVTVTGSAIAGGYDAAPALMLCLGLALAFPLVIFGVRLFGAVRARADVTRRYKPGKVEAVQIQIEGADTAAPAHAFVEVEGAGARRFEIARDMLRIGREDDNDIRIPSGAVHRYHAAIHREDLDAWYITDLSGTGGNGITVNGRRCSDARLADGDIIQLGPGRLKFRAGFA